LEGEEQPRNSLAEVQVSLVEGVILDPQAADEHRGNNEELDTPASIVEFGSPFGFAEANQEANGLADKESETCSDQETCSPAVVTATRGRWTLESSPRKPKAVREPGHDPHREVGDSDPKHLEQNVAETSVSLFRCASLGRAPSAASAAKCETAAAGALQTSRQTHQI
jgi:hypothetical protein